jgi:hypothetical protein
MSGGHFSGNAESLGASFGGWFVGPYHLPDDEMVARPNLEMKWGSHSGGEARQDWDAGSASWSLSILITGSFNILFEDRTVELRAPGDFAMWRPLTRHSWLAITDAVVVTVRWNEQGPGGNVAGT